MILVDDLTQIANLKIIFPVTVYSEYSGPHYAPKIAYSKEELQNLLKEAMSSSPTSTAAFD